VGSPRSPRLSASTRPAPAGAPADAASSGQGGGISLPGIALMVGASVCYALMSALVKVASGGLDFTTIIAGRSLVVVVVSLGLTLRIGASLRPSNVKLVVSRSLTGFAAMCCYFYAISAISLADAVALQYTSPIFVALLANVWLGERVRAQTWAMIGLAFGGILLIISPDFSDFNPLGLIALASAVMSAVSYLTVRQLRSSDSPETIVLYFGLISLIASVPGVFIWGAGWPQTATQWLALLGTGVFATGGQVLMTHAFRYGEAAVMSAFSYATVLISALFGVWWFGESLTWASAVGVALVVGAGVGVSIRRGGTPHPR
jgi:drug/metabolite transporter (DMT)-like permease